MDEQRRFIQLIASRLDSARIPYMLTGSMAMAVYSIPRMTRDIDLVIEVEAADVERLFDLFAKDCYIDREIVKEAVNAHSMFNIIHNKWVIKADFIIKKNEEYRREEFSRRQKIALEDSTVFVVSPEDLILSKLVWGKQSQSDLQVGDVRQMIAVVPKLDWQYIKKWAIILRVDSLLQKAKNNG
jgi:hypothetical protein